MSLRKLIPKLRSLILKPQLKKELKKKYLKRRERIRSCMK
jgi:hypothetical protein